MISLTSPVETRAHRWRAGAKLGALCLATLALFFAPDIAWLGAALALTLGVYALPPWAFLRAGLSRLRPVMWVAVLIALWHGLAGDWLEGANIALRILTAVAMANLVTMTTRLSDMLDVIAWLLRPAARFGMNTRPAELGVALMIRFTPNFAERARQLHHAWRARSIRRANWRLVMPLTILALDDAEHVAEALKARGGVAASSPTPDGGTSNGT